MEPKVKQIGRLWRPYLQVTKIFTQLLHKNITHSISQTLSSATLVPPKTQGAFDKQCIKKNSWQWEGWCSPTFRPGGTYGDGGDMSPPNLVVSLTNVNPIIKIGKKLFVEDTFRRSCLDQFLFTRHAGTGQTGLASIFQIPKVEATY